MSNACVVRYEQAHSVSFADMVRDRFSSQLYAELARYAKLQSIDLQNVALGEVIVTGMERDVLYAHVYFDCKVNESGSLIRKPFVADCYFNIQDGFQQIHFRCIGPTWPTFQIKQSLPDDLVPSIAKDQLDDVARALLKDLYPNALRNAIPVPAVSVAHRLGLSVHYAGLDPNDEILGKIYFEDSTAAVQDSADGRSRILAVKRGTMLINRRPDGRFDPRISNNTILHECVHWMLHRQAYELQKAYDPQLTAIACRRASALNRSREWTALDRMEWQANALAPRILMPEWSTRMYTDQWIRRMEKVPPKLRMDRIVEKLSCYYEVSRSLARIRLIELGYQDAKLGYAAPVQYKIDFQDAMQEFLRNESFRNVLAAGEYAYVDKHFCIRDSRYIFRGDDGVLHLSAYAKSHLAECCLAFDVQRRSAWTQDGMLRDKRQTAQYVEAAFDTQHLTKTTRDVNRILMSLPSSFGATLEAHMQRTGMTQERLAEASLITDRRIRTYCVNEQMVPLPRVVALCIGLKLHPIFAFDLVKKAGYLFNQTPEHVAYQMILVSMTYNSIYECNDYLKTLGLKPIGKEE